MECYNQGRRANWHSSEMEKRMKNFSVKVGLIWSVADLLRGPYKQHQYGSIILPFTVLRRLDQVYDKVTSERRR